MCKSIRLPATSARARGFAPLLRDLETGKTKASFGSGVPRDQDMLALKREMDRAKKERVFRDAAVFFAREPIWRI